MEIFKIKNCVALIIDFFGFKTMFISLLMMGNWLSFLFNYLKNIKDTFFSKFYDNNNANREVQ